MANYQKYMFDDFVVKNDNDEYVLADEEQQFEYEPEENIETELFESEVADDKNEEYVEEKIQETQNVVPIENNDSEFVAYDYVKEPETEENLAVYTEEEFQEAMVKAEEVAYNRGLEEAKNSSLEKQNILLEDIKNQLMTIFTSLDDKKTDMEKDTLNFSVNLVRKILPTLEKERAEKEVKNFLAENFANFSSQEALSFSFNPDTISKVADSIGRLAEQNDFEGKISVHKDVSLGPSDCRVEWKSGGVERKSSNVLDKVTNLINTKE